MSSLAEILEHVLKDGVEYPINLAEKKSMISPFVHIRMPTLVQ